MCLIFWYLNMTSIVKWGSKTSQPFTVPLGIKQGGINSPEFFALYVDEVIKLMRKKAIGCHIYKLFLAILMFADDLCLLAPTRSSLAEMITTVSSFCTKYGFEFNPKKSKILVFSKCKVDHTSLQPVYLNGKPIDYVTSIKYLGTTILSKPNFVFSAADELKSYYRAANAILNTLKKPNEQVLLHLLFTNCVPILTYDGRILLRAFCRQTLLWYDILIFIYKLYWLHKILKGHTPNSRYIVPGNNKFLPIVKDNAWSQLLFLYFLLISSRHYRIRI